ncbi:MAG TPA: ABC transporter ATP-binding protein [Candidatus Acidoferrum sp.]|jgi:oligopeptide/dipeptide ABC transporter ATP-binding protein|nr:ABC transporter ATP-binding protein [Candidatus Acidoferrum sp.]
MSTLLDVQDLHVAYRTRAGGDYPALAGVSFGVQAGEILGVLGESGSGKSTLAAAMLRLLPANGKIQKGTVRFEGRDLLQAHPRELRKIRGGRVGLIFQEPSMALHPTIRVGEQVSDVLAAHVAMGRSERREKSLQVLTTVFPEEAKRIAESYPHQLSGGQRQRVLMAQATACGPAMVIADEPTASLDPSTQQEILAHLRMLRQRLNLAMILITHNPAVLAGLADRILVLYAGRIAEMGPTEKVLASPQHPYTQALLQCLPPPIAEEPFPGKGKLTVIAGDSPNLAQLGNGCRFEPRCKDRMEICIQREPAVVPLSETHAVACFKYGG